MCKLSLCSYQKDSTTIKRYEFSPSLLCSLRDYNWRRGYFSEERRHQVSVLVSTMALVGKIDDFRPEVEPWTAYIERLEQYLEANDIDEEKHVAVLLSVMGAKAYGLLRNLVQPEKPKDKTFGEIVDILKEHYETKPILVAERFCFNRCNQKTSQTVAQYVAELKQQAANCDFGASLDSALRDRFVSGINKIDTGAAKSVISHSTYLKKFSHLPLQPAKVKLKAYNGGRICVLGQLVAKVVYEDQATDLPLLIVKGHGASLCGRNWLTKLRLNWQQIKYVGEPKHLSLNELLDTYNDVFKEELGTLKDIKATIVVWQYALWALNAPHKCLTLIGCSAVCI
ncbi:uncharacterized protein LOC111609437 [Xiphophorus maculatus]|uniref:uncharacterized protein LOC111609437 n=1 Tax=Xiphophorus maculatus TaxID=8083 RepID=UPI000C6E429E|nr:uncharacterized protein LOC111609437 [Xiphophorus maculatus]